MSHASVPRVRLELIQIQDPCPADWSGMRAVEGESPGQVRHCGSCDLNVYNISSMTRQEAERFLVSRSGFGRTCIRMYQRHDGTVVTADCSRVRAAALASVRKVRWAAIAAATVLAGSLAFVDGWLPRNASGAPVASSSAGSRPLLVVWVDRASEWLVEKLMPPISTPPVAVLGDVPMVMGAMAMPRNSTDCLPPLLPEVALEPVASVVSPAP